MRKLFVLFGVFVFASFFGAIDVLAQEVAEPATGFQVLKEKFIEGDWFFMSFVLVCLILGLAFCIERIITLNIATTNTDRLLSKVDERLADNDMEGAMETLRSTPGPTASVLLEGLKKCKKWTCSCRKSYCFLWFSANGTFRKRTCLDFTFYCDRTDAWIYGYGNRDDWSL